MQTAQVAPERFRLREGQPGRTVSREVLQWAQALASWRRRYADRLADDEPR